MKKPLLTASEREKKIFDCMLGLVMGDDNSKRVFFPGDGIFNEGSGLKMKASGAEVDNHHKDCLEG